MTKVTIDLTTLKLVGLVNVGELTATNSCCIALFPCYSTAFLSYVIFVQLLYKKTNTYVFRLSIYDYMIVCEMQTDASNVKMSTIFYRAMHVVLARYCYRKSSVRPSVCLSVCLSVCNVDVP